METQSGADRKGERASEPPAAKPSFWAQPIVIVIGAILLAFLFFLGIGYMVRSFTRESTDDAFLDGQIISIAPKVSGQVTNVHVRHNQRVKAGDLLIEIDPRDFQITLQQKKAAVDSARANVELLRASLELLKAQVASAEATARESASQATAAQATAQKAEADLKRAQELIRAQTISAQEYDSAKAISDASAANFKAAQERAASDDAKVQQMKAQLEAGRKAYERGEAQTRQAEWDTQAADLNLSYTKVTAPEDGFVTKRAVETGDFVQVGQKIMALVTTRLWVTANFKETQLKRIRTNQPAVVEIDSLGGRTFAAHVESIQAGSGARFSLLPPENAVGNYVKVVQRVPVRLFFDEPLQTEHVLGPGMSVSPSVRVRSFALPQVLILFLAIVPAAALGFLWFVASRRRRNQPVHEPPLRAEGPA